MANGWTDDNICVRWLEMSFIPGVKVHADLSKPIVLLYDGHGSHVTLEMIDMAMWHNIILFCLPPHMTHRLQPCDVGAFGPLKHAWNKWCDHVYQTTGEPLAAKDFVREYMLGQKESFKVDTIKKLGRSRALMLVMTDQNVHPRCSQKRTSHLATLPPLFFISLTAFLCFLSQLMKILLMMDLVMNLMTMNSNLPGVTMLSLDQLLGLDLAQLQIQWPPHPLPVSMW